MNELVAFWESHFQVRRSPFAIQFKRGRYHRSRMPKRELLPGYTELHTATKGITVRWIYKGEYEL